MGATNSGTTPRALKSQPSRVNGAQVSDRDIEMEAEKTFNFRVLLENRITASALKGIVTLKGTARDDEERRLAIETVKCVEGVQSVRDKLILLRQCREEDDIVVVGNIRSRLLSKANVNVESIRIAASNGVISLKGVVDNPVRKAVIESIVIKVSGVLSLQNEIEVDRSAIFSTPDEIVDDASITGLITVALQTNGFNAEVQSEGGVVVLSGVASDRSERIAIGCIAQSFRGVKWVNNEM